MLLSGYDKSISIFKKTIKKANYTDMQEIKQICYESNGKVWEGLGGKTIHFFATVWEII